MVAVDADTKLRQILRGDEQWGDGTPLEQATSFFIANMLDDVVAEPPNDAKGQDLVPQWEADYRAYIADRRAFTADLRESGANLPFYETQVSGIPVSEKLEVFAADNRMATCAPPRDLTR